MLTIQCGFDLEACPCLFIDTHSIQLVQVRKNTTAPHYAILSHRWIHGEEISFQDFLDGPNRSNIKSKLGYIKICEACSKAQELGLQYLWVDTCCIDQKNCTEVASNIQSMYAYYHNAVVCLVYLFDIFSDGDIHQSEWFKRGWTLQELLASETLLFFYQDWKEVNSHQLPTVLESATGISWDILSGMKPIADVDIWERCRWFQVRKTTRPQDIFYCSMTILGIQLEVWYDEDVQKTSGRFWHKFVQLYPYAQMIFPIITQGTLLPGSSAMVLLYPHLPTSLDSQQLLNRESELCPQCLIDTLSMQLVNFDEGKIIPPYAIFSHRWVDEEEVSYQELIELGKPYAKIQPKLGYFKLQMACAIAHHLGIYYVWADTCCIDQRNHADVHQNIQSMHAFYQNSAICLAYLHDIQHEQDLGSSDWFSRGWTLQELVAPHQVLFFGKHWNFIGARTKLKSQIEAITEIEAGVLEGTSAIKNVDVASKIRWVQGRRTTKPQDFAFCLLGILDIKMKVDYGKTIEDIFVELQQKLVESHPELSVSSGLELTWSFLAAGHPVPPISWPPYKSKKFPHHLIDTETMHVVQSSDRNDTMPKYAILSHRWKLKHHDCFQDKQNSWRSQITQEIHKACDIARQLGLCYLWVDCCCIDQEDQYDVDIAAVYDYFLNSSVCFLYVDDEDRSQIQSCSWSKLWPLLDLVAPQELLVFDKNWKFDWSRQTLKKKIAEITMIDESLLDGSKMLNAEQQDIEKRRLHRLFKDGNWPGHFFSPMDDVLVQSMALHQIEETGQFSRSRKIWEDIMKQVNSEEKSLTSLTSD